MKFFGYQAASICVLAVLCWLGWGGWRIYHEYTFNIGCSGHLKRAADANTIDLAKIELKTVIDYLDQQNMKSGTTSVFFQTPECSFWYQNLIASYEELQTVTPATTQLEKTNVLMKLRETLLDHGEKGDQVTKPPGIAVFPSIITQFWFSWIIGLIAVFSGTVAGLILIPD